ncbi:MAG: spore germination protein [Firmicutes bacterium]|nr:spore germination protein [Bacillota bacterium]
MRMRRPVPLGTVESAPPGGGVVARVEELRRLLAESSDVLVRYFGGDGGGEGQGAQLDAAILWIDGLADLSLMTQGVVGPLSAAVDDYARGRSGRGADECGHAEQDEGAPLQTLGQPFRMEEHRLSAAAVRRLRDPAEAAMLAVRGHTLVISAGDPDILACNTSAYFGRQVQEPSNESTITGSKESFVESLRVNTSLIRQRVASPRLRVEELSIGRISRTKVAVIHIDGIANDAVVNEVRQRLSMVDVDAVHELGHLKELIADAPYSLFTTMLRTERPDRVAAALLEGRVALLADSTPFAMVVPQTFIMTMTTPEDYYERFSIGTATRVIRILAFIVSLLLPASYVAVITFHQELLPTPLILSIAAQREGIPFPAAFEAILMELTFEVVREAGIRLPRLVGPTVSIVGVLVLGDAAIRSGLVSPIMVIVVAATGVASFTAPSYSTAMAVRVLRFVFLAAGSALGLYGVTVCLLTLLAHLTALESFGVPYMSPVAPLVPEDLRDALWRVPWWLMRRRPSEVQPKDTRRHRGGEGS